MRVLARLRARADAAYNNAYHHKLSGRIWNALEGTKYDAVHNNDDPKPFVFSNPFPPGDLREGDERTVLIASTEEPLLTHVARDLQDEREWNIGEMPFHVEAVSALSPDVGEPGTSGRLSTGTGVVVRIPPQRFDEYGIEVDHDEAEFWRPEHSMNPFQNQIHANLDRKHGLFEPDYLPGPTDTDGDLFDGYELIKTFAIPVTPTTGVTETWVLSKWRFDYTVRDDDHRRHLNLALDVGIGERNSLGFGFMNIVEKTGPGESELEGENAFA
ncbi:CRISPR-associated endoribonuclease Cas6 [Halanaeroarchaeum sulfurireducens]|uniref:CRISPR-associated protein Cas6 n=1 Tax=Halanaeroarchaeum sulfurireducens TaxID=1604004 RepID=A0A0N9N3X6_9EURY|nr:CRISPR-associated endoribonuclease Cas6 [Halanaeroarchaeum sulfurireducens]ALG81758.1 CRISPR-associated protein Cas6 [Halanaeroarchaeum sulfurireducens]